MSGCLAWCLIGVAGLTAPDPRVLSEVLTISPHRPVAVVGIGLQQGLQLGDRVVVVRGEQLVATGPLLLVTADHAAFRVDGRLAGPRPGDQVIVVPGGWLVGTRRRLPEAIGLAGTIAAVSPGARVGWIDLGGCQGVVRGDRFCVMREQLPLATATVVMVTPTASLIILQPVVANLTSRPGDAVRAVSSPARPLRGAVCYVVQARPERDGQRLWLAGELGALAALDTPIRLYRQGRYLAQAIVHSVPGPLAEASTIPGLAREPVAAGDLGRAPPGSPGDEPLGYVFRIEEDYVLVSTSRGGQVQVGQRLYARRARRCVAQLEVKTRERTFCGARLVPAEAADVPLFERQSLTLWDEVSTRPPADWLGQSPPWRVALVLSEEVICLQGPLGQGQGPAPGTLIALAADEQIVAAGLVLLNTDRQVLVFAPRCWQQCPILTEMLLSCCPLPDEPSSVPGQE